MRPLAPLLLTCQLRQEGEGGCLIQAARTGTDDPRGLASLFGYGVSARTNKYHDVS